MAEKLSIDEFLKASENIPVIDVRSPGEYETAHIPGAFNIPIFNNNERAEVGIIYKQKSKQKAVLKGLEIVGPKLKDLAQQAKDLSYKSELLLHCWRGGMRSASMAWLFETIGLKVKILQGGYKAYRQYIKQQLAQKTNIIILSGYTGCGKTDILKALKSRGEQIINIEDLAHHKGSAFGSIGESEQLKNEMFENELYKTFHELDISKRIWIEDESQCIGRNFIPGELFFQMRVAEVIKINLPVEKRIKRLLKEYIKVDKQQLIDNVIKIKKRLGPQNAKSCIEAIKADDYYNAIKIALIFYDKAYQNGLNKRSTSKIHNIEIQEDEPEETSKKLLKLKTSF